MTRLLLILTLLALLCGPASAQTVYDNGAVHDYHPEITYSHFRFEPFWFNSLYIVYDNGGRPAFNPDWHGMYVGRLVITRDWFVPYPSGWELTDFDIQRVVNATNFDGNLNGVPDWIEWDTNADGYCNLSDLTWFGVDYGQELVDGEWQDKRWDLSDFSAMGSLFNSRRDDE